MTSPALRNRTGFAATVSDQDLRNIVAFGADKTGVVECSSAYSRAVNSLPPTGGIIFFPRGRFKFDATLLFQDKDITLMGSGPGTVLDIGSGAFALATTPGSASTRRRYRLDDFTVDGDATAGSALLNYNEPDSNAWIQVSNVYANRTLESVLKISGYNNDSTFARYARIKFFECQIFPTVAACNLITSVDAAGVKTGGFVVEFDGCILADEFDLSQFTNCWSMDAAVDLILTRTRVAFEAGCKVNGFSASRCGIDITGGDFFIKGPVANGPDGIQDCIFFGLDFSTFDPSRVIYQADLAPFFVSGTIFSITTLRLEGSGDIRAVVGCYFPASGLTPMGIDVRSDLARIDGCEFGDPFGGHTDQAILITNAQNCTVTGCGFTGESGGVKTVKEVGTSDNNKITGCTGLTGAGSFVKLGASTIIDAVSRNITILDGSADPSAGGGVAAPQPALYIRSNGQTWVKTGGGDTAWTQT